MYSTVNFKSKKELKQAVADGKLLTIFQPNDMFDNPKAARNYSGSATLEGPHYPQPHKWYAQVEVTDGYITKVK